MEWSSISIYRKDHFNLTMILALTSAHRCETLQALSLDNDQFVFHFKTLSKTSGPGKHLAPLVVKAYHSDARL